MISDKAKKLNSVIFTKEKSGILSTKAEQLEWRRSKVVEMRSRGLSQTEIAHELQVSGASISSDMQNIYVELTPR
jgi:DNA-binding NarL/FixJ family response regulator